jgi:dolichol-phosphate mannosyltransferase
MANAQTNNHLGQNRLPFKRQELHRRMLKFSSAIANPCYNPLDSQATPAQRPNATPTPPPGATPDAGLPTLALVIPTFREAGSLPAILARVRAALDASRMPCEIIIVDDDSQDGTAELVSSIARQDSRIRLLVRKGERGLSGAILHGWQQTAAPILGVMDADLQHPPETLPDLIAAVLGGTDLAIASRYVRDRLLGSWNPIRKLISAVAVALARPLQRPPIRVIDPMSGFFLVRRRCIHNVIFQPTGFKLLLEILVRGHVGSVREIPFALGCRTAGRSKANLKVAWEYFHLLICLYSIRGQRPPIITKEPAGD